MAILKQTTAGSNSFYVPGTIQTDSIQIQGLNLNGSELTFKNTLQVDLSSNVGRPSFLNISDSNQRWYIDGSLAGVAASNIGLFVRPGGSNSQVFAVQTYNNSNIFAVNTVGAGNQGLVSIGNANNTVLSGSNILDIFGNTRTVGTINITASKGIDSIYLGSNVVGGASEESERMIVLRDYKNEGGQFTGFGASNAALHYQVPISSGRHLFKGGVNASEWMRIQSDVNGLGQVGISTSTIATGIALAVAGNVTISGTIYASNLAPSAYSDTTIASNITSGILPAARMPATTVVAGSYGFSNTIPIYTVGYDGRLTFASNVPISIISSNITDLSRSATIDATNATNIISGTLPAARMPATTVVAGSYGFSNTVPIYTVGYDGRLTFASNVPIRIISSNITDLSRSATIDATNATNIISGTLPAARIPATTVVTGRYGYSNTVAMYIVDTDGRLTLASNIPIAITTNNVSGLSRSATIDTVIATNITEGTLPAARLPATAVVAGRYGSTDTVPVYNVGADGRLTLASNVPITISWTSVTGLSGGNVDTTQASNITSGTLAVARLPQSGVVAANYGNINQTPSFNVDIYGRITLASNITNKWVETQSNIYYTNTSGFVGIGTTAPRANLDVVGNVCVNSGNVGIGLTNPLVRLHVAGDTTVTGTLITSNLQVLGAIIAIKEFALISSNIIIDNYGIGPALSVWQSEQSMLNPVAEFLAGNCNALYIDSFANVGVGTNNPQTPFHVVGLAAVTRLGVGTTTPIDGSALNVIGNVVVSGTGSFGGNPLVASAFTNTRDAANINSGILPAERLPATAVVAGSYGSSNTVPIYTVGADGRLSFASNVPIAITTTNVSGLARSATIDTVIATNITEGTLPAGRMPATAVVAGSYGYSNTVPVYTVGADGRLSFASNVPIAITTTNVSGLARSATIDTVIATNITEGTLPAGRLPATAVMAGSYGYSNTIPVYTVGADGRLSFASNVPIAITSTNISDLVRSATIDTVIATNITEGTLPAARLPATAVVAGSYGYSNTVPVYSVGADGRLSFASNVPIAISSTNVSDLVRSATIDTTNATNIDGGTLSADRLPLSGVAAGSYGNYGTTPALVVDVSGRITGLSNIPVNINLWKNIGTDSVYMTSNVGIGTSKPEQSLHVAGAAVFTSNVGIGTLFPTSVFQIMTSNTSPAMYIKQSGSGSIMELWNSNMYPAIVVNSNANVGIGTALARTPFHVVGASTFSGNIIISDVTSLNIPKPGLTPLPTLIGMFLPDYTNISGIRTSSQSYTTITSYTTLYTRKQTDSTIIIEFKACPFITTTATNGSFTLDMVLKNETEMITFANKSVTPFINIASVPFTATAANLYLVPVTLRYTIQGNSIVSSIAGDKISISLQALTSVAAVIFDLNSSFPGNTAQFSITEYSGLALD